MSSERKVTEDFGESKVKKFCIKILKSIQKIYHAFEIKYDEVKVDRENQEGIQEKAEELKEQKFGSKTGT